MEYTMSDQPADIKPSDPKPTDLKARIVYVGLTVVFIAEFGEFVCLRVWHVIQPVAVYIEQLIKHQ